MNSNRLFVRRLQADYLVPSDHPDPLQIKHHLDGEIRKNLEASLSTVLWSSFAQSDSSLWFIRRLEVDLAVNASPGVDNVTREMTNQVAFALFTTLDPTADQNNVIRFENSTAYLKQFLCDLADGDAWSRWYYETFEGLRMLPTSAALRTAVLDDSLNGRDALAQLDAHELDHVLRSLTRDDSVKILEGLAEHFPAGDQFRCCELIWEAWQTVDRQMFDRLSDEARALSLYVSASDNEEAGLNLERAALALLRLASLLSTASSESNVRLISSILDDDVSSLYLVAGSNAEVLLPLKQCPASWLKEVAGKLVANGELKQTDTDGPRSVSFGGAFLLLPLLDDLPLESATADWSDSDEAAAISLVRFLIILKLCGPEHAKRLFNESVLRELLLIPSSLSLESLLEWQRGVSNSQLEKFISVLIDWQVARGTVDLKHLILSASADEFVLTDSSRGFWLRIQQRSEMPPAQFIESLNPLLIEVERQDGLLLCAPELLQLLWSNYPTLKILSLDDGGREVETVADIEDVLNRLGHLANDLSYLSLPHSLIVSPLLDLAFSVAGQHVLRSFAWKLPGFGGSYLQYLSENFLDFSAGIEEEPSRRVVRLGGVPLQLILSITGLTRQTYRLSWLDDRPFTLFPEM